MTRSKSKYRFSLIWVIYKAFMQHAEALRQQVKIHSFLPYLRGMCELESQKIRASYLAPPPPGQIGLKEYFKSLIKFA